MYVEEPLRFQRRGDALGFEGRDAMRDSLGSASSEDEYLCVQVGVVDGRECYGAKVDRYSLYLSSSSSFL